MAGLDDAQLRQMLGGSSARIAAGAEAFELTPPRGPADIAHPLTFARIHQYLSMATPLLWTRQPDTIGVLGLALNACDERSNGHREETEQIRELLSVARELWRAGIPTKARPPRRQQEVCRRTPDGAQISVRGGAAPGRGASGAGSATAAPGRASAGASSRASTGAKPSPPSCVTIWW